MTTAFIPVRGGSKSIPLKNIKELNGMPLVYWCIKAAHDSGVVNKIIVATDSDTIASVVHSFGIDSVQIYRRDAANATDTASTESAMIEYLERSHLAPDEKFILIQATSPLTRPEHFAEAIHYYTVNDFDSLLTGVRTKRFYWNLDGTPINYDYRSRPRRQDFEGIIVENGAFYISTVGNILRSKNRLSGKVGIYEMPEHTCIEIDEPEDWQAVETLMKTVNRTSSPNYPEIKLFLSDMDGTLTDSGMYYSDKGDELKRFSTYDGKAFELLQDLGIRTGILTSENTKIAEKRADKLKVDFLHQGISGSQKLSVAQNLCQDLDISLENVAYIGDDINCIELLSNVGLAGCPANSRLQVKQVPNIIVMQSSGGNGAVRDFADLIISTNRLA